MLRLGVSPATLMLGVSLTCDLDVEVGVEQQVLGLEVAVHDALAVAIRHRRHDLLELPPRLLLDHASVGNEVICEHTCSNAL